jgi:hypothetical protein
MAKSDEMCEAAHYLVDAEEILNRLKPTMKMVMRQKRKSLVVGVAIGYLGAPFIRATIRGVSEGLRKNIDKQKNDGFTTH